MVIGLPSYTFNHCYTFQMFVFDVFRCLLSFSPSVLTLFPLPSSISFAFFFLFNSYLCCCCFWCVLSMVFIVCTRNINRLHISVSRVLGDNEKLLARNNWNKRVSFSCVPIVIMNAIDHHTNRLVCMFKCVYCDMFRQKPQCVAFLFLLSRARS